MPIVTRGASSSELLRLLAVSERVLMLVSLTWAVVASACISSIQDDVECDNLDTMPTMRAVVVAEWGE
jgi:hypothetical protein